MLRVGPTVCIEVAHRPEDDGDECMEIDPRLSCIDVNIIATKSYPCY